MVLRAWYMDSTDADQRAPHQLSPSQPVAPEYLHKRLGVVSWALDMSGPPDANEQLSAIRKERNYSYMDVITISPEKLENYEAKLKIFFKEHLHTDEEIRLILVRAAQAGGAGPLVPGLALTRLAPPPLSLDPFFRLAGGHGLL